MARQHEVTVRIPEADSVEAAIEWIRERDSPYGVLELDVTDDGQVTGRPGPAAHFLTPARVTGRITDDGAGPVLVATIHKVASGMIWPWLMGVPAVVLLVCSIGIMVLEGVSMGPLLIGAPGGLLLGFMAWYLVRQQDDHFRHDVGTITEALTDYIMDNVIDPDED
ncbi:hypothetical protein J2S43_001366 [Catenuloplanes nepalensis]|uniref:Uncharacterized protein n=1 Tax=Catenuloplanes nepalensis TaxID=587533 RepID=A0ABT9MN41_9ACTN|nr:hypothetical protein [Catenuloplanes nepalensis]MDP9792854.1 hypothetical protein [Catenuloplanes nepalensis]